MIIQDKTKEKGLEDGNINKQTESIADFEKKGSEDFEKETGLEEISSPERDQEKKKEVMEAISQKGGAGKKDDSSDGGDQEDSTIQIHAEDISKIKDVEQQIDKLVKLAIQKDPFTAMKVAKSLDENYILDRTHDELVEEKTREALINKGLLKNI